MKFAQIGDEARRHLSRPPQGGWIEIVEVVAAQNDRDKSRPPQGGWIEICTPEKCGTNAASRPPQGGWIEISARASLPRL